MICVTLRSATLQEWGAEVARSRPHADLYELRVDLLHPAQREVERLVEWCAATLPETPCILTVRRPRDLGRWEGDEAQRLFLMTNLVSALRPRWVDIELDRAGNPGWDRLAALVQQEGGSVIRSHHEPAHLPGDLDGIIARLSSDRREIPKLAVTVQNLGETTRFLSSVETYMQRMGRREGLWIAMGEDGVVTRVLATRFGGRWTYASADLGDGAAPGQLDAQTLDSLYRVRSSAADRAVCAVVGDPISHSKSPELHNPWLVEAGLDAVYLPLHATTLDEALALADLLPITGMSVTVPHKEAALKAASTATDVATRVGAANTLVRTGTRWHADNTDVAGFLHALHQVTRPPASRRAVVVGAGGAAAAVVVALIDDGWEVTICNRTPERAVALATRLGLGAGAGRGLEAIGTDGVPALIVQSTPVGMHDDGDPIGHYAFTGGEIVGDLIYNPRETTMLARARAAGCATFNGEAMLRRQAELQRDHFVAALRALPVSHRARAE